MGFGKISLSISGMILGHFLATLKVLLGCFGLFQIECIKATDLVLMALLHNGIKLDATRNNRDRHNFESEGWGFESLRMHQTALRGARRFYPSCPGVFVVKFFHVC